MTSNIDKSAQLFQSLQLRRERLNEQIADSIEEMIAVNQLRPGTQLPSERELAKLMGVNRATVREAIRILEHRGLVTMRMGSGTYIADLSSATVAESIERYLVFGQCSHEDLIELRELLDPEIAALAASKASGEDLHTLHKLAGQVQAAFAQGTAKEYAQLDTAFHEMLAGSTHNPLVIAIVAGLHRVVQGWILAQSVTLRIEEGARSHLRVAEGVASRDPETARQSMRYHNQFLRQTMVRDDELSGKRLFELLASLHAS